MGYLLLVSGVWCLVLGDWEHCLRYAFAYASLMRSHCGRFCNRFGFQRAFALRLALACLSWKRAISASQRFWCQPSSRLVKNSDSTASTARRCAGVVALASL